MQTPQFGLGHNCRWSMRRNMAYTIAQNARKSRQALEVATGCLSRANKGIPHRPVETPSCRGKDRQRNMSNPPPPGRFMLYKKDNRVTFLSGVVLGLTCVCMCICLALALRMLLSHILRRGTVNLLFWSIRRNVCLQMGASEVSRGSHCFLSTLQGGLTNNSNHAHTP